MRATFERRLTLVFFLALGVTGAAIVGLHELSRRNALEHMTDPPAIRLAGQLGTLFGKLSTDSTFTHVSGSKQGLVSLVRGMHETLERIESIQGGLERGDAGLGLTPLAGPESAARLGALDQAWRPIGEATCAMLSLYESAADMRTVDSERSGELLTSIQDGEQPYVEAADLLVQHLTERSHRALQQLRTAQSVLLGVALLALALLGILVFRPTLRIIERQFQEKLALQGTIDEARRAESLSMLTRGIAHDFNNLLVGVLGNAELLAQRMPAGSPSRVLAEQLQESARRCADLVKEMQTYVGQGDARREPLDLSAFVREQQPGLAALVSLPRSIANNPPH